ncbi:hypothetical protein C9J85_17820 [Haloferax sp. wsp5]|nr:hypothetical protein C9J85_17820 [Haloferax sp. wsp5]
MRFLQRRTRRMPWTCCTIFAVDIDESFDFDGRVDVSVVLVAEPDLLTSRSVVFRLASPGG